MSYLCGQIFYYGLYPSAGLWELLVWPYYLGKKLRIYLLANAKESS